REVGLGFGLAILIFGTAGISLGGVISARLRRRGHVDSDIRVGAVAVAFLMPIGIIVPLLPSAWAALALYGLLVFFASVPYGAAAAALMEVTPNQMRA